MRPSVSGVPVISRLGRLGSSLIIEGAFLVVMYNVPVGGSTAPLPQLPPPLFPGISTVSFVPAGVKIPSLRAFCSCSLVFARSAGSLIYGSTSSGVNVCVANGGGAIGNGCVGQEGSPGISDWGTGHSPIGQICLPV